MYRPQRFVWLAALTFIAALGCRSATKTPEAAVVDAAHGVVLPHTPALMVGGFGEGPGQFRALGPAAFDDEGRLIVADNRLRRLVWFDSTGALVQVRAYSPSEGTPLLPTDTIRWMQALAFHGGTLYLGTPDGVWLVGKDEARLVPLPELGGYLRALAVGNDGRIYALTDRMAKVYTPDGVLADSLVPPERPDMPSPGSRALDIGPDGRIYVAARRWGQILVYRPDGTFEGNIGERGNEPGRFRSVNALAVDAYGNVYGYDGVRQTIEAFAADGSFAAEIGARGSQPGQMLSCTQLLVDRARHRLAALDPTNYRVQIFDLTGKDTGARNLVVHETEFAPRRTPDHVVLSLGDDPRTERRIAWRTDTTATGTQVLLVRVDEHADPSGVDWDAPSVRRIEGTSLVHWGNLGPYRAHEATLTGLVPGARYAYRVGDGSPDGWSRTAFFTMPAGTEERIRVVVLGDSRNRMEVWRAVISASAGQQPAFIISTGDLVSNGENMDDWDRWFHEARNIFDHIPFMPSIGNHERMSQNYFLAFALPRNAPPELAEQCYSFDYGPAHWVVLNTEAALEPQTRWLVEDLKANTKPWTFVVFHRPAYAGHPSRGDGNKDVRTAWSELFERYGVEIAWQGHDHYYMRTKPIRQEQIVAPGEGPIYITTGGAGAPLYAIAPNQYTEIAEKVDHFCMVDLTPTEANVVVYRADGSVLDRFTVHPRMPEG